MSYQIHDEPERSGLNHLAVRPVWPLFGVMFAGSWLAFPWFAFNGFALGCPQRIRTLVAAVIGFVGSFLITSLIFFLAAMYDWDKYMIRYALSVLLLWKLGLAYYLLTLQSRTFQLYEYFDGKTRNGIFVVFLAYYLLRPRLIDELNAFWLYVVL